jgi:beta-lactamase class A
MKLSRRGFVAGSLATGGLLASGCSGTLEKPIEDALGNLDPPQFVPGNRFEAMLRQIEGEADGTLGVELFDIATGVSVGINADRRFGHCSSFKLSLAAKVLQRHSTGEDDAERRVAWSADDLMFVSPFTERRLGEGATLRELAEATQKYSDNAAANILLREIGGPVALTGFWRSIGDAQSRLDRYEPELNDVPVTEYRDTTTPPAMARTVAKLAYGDVLPAEERAQLRQWMIETPTGARRVRAGLPEGWVAGDKTGTSIWPGMGSLYVDIGFVEVPASDKEWRTGPITFATYFRTREPKDGMDPGAEAALARVGEVLTRFSRDGGDWPF